MDGQGAVSGAAGVQEPGDTPWAVRAGAVVLASINIFGGFIVTQRMLAMYKKKADTGKKKDGK